LGGIDNPIFRGASEALGQAENAWREGQISLEQRSEANRHAERVAEIELEKHNSSLSEINTTLRQELASEDKYVRRMRPTFGYVMAATWGAQMLAIAYVLIFDTAKAGVILNGMASLSAIWAVGLSVLGIYVYKRSEDKKIFTRPSDKEVIYWNEEEKS